MAKTKSVKELEAQIFGLKEKLAATAAGQSHKHHLENFTQRINELEQKVTRLENNINRLKESAGKLYLATEDLERLLDEFPKYANEYRTSSKLRAQVELLRKTLARARQSYRRET